MVPCSFDYNALALLGGCWLLVNKALDKLHYNKIYILQNCILIKYNSVRYEQQSLNDLFADNKYNIQAYCIDDINNDMYNHTYCIDVNPIVSAVHKLI